MSGRHAPFSPWLRFCRASEKTSENVRTLRRAWERKKETFRSSSHVLVRSIARGRHSTTTTRSFVTARVVDDGGR